MGEEQSSKRYDLGDRTLKFARMTRNYVKGLPRDVANIEYAQQLIRSSGSVGANYIEAQEALSKKDFAMRIKISRKEAKESRYWLELTESASNRMASGKDPDPGGDRTYPDIRFYRRKVEASLDLELETCSFLEFGSWNLRVGTKMGPGRLRGVPEASSLGARCNRDGRFVRSVWRSFQSV